MALLSVSDSELAFRKIIFGYDGSDHAGTALTYLCSIAKRASDRVIIVSVHKRDSAEEIKAVQATAATALRALADVLGEAAVTVQTFRGSAKEVLCDVARDERADLVVMGARGRGAVARFMLGSVSTYVVHSVAIDALVVNRNTPRAQRRILVAHDGSELAEKAFKAALALSCGHEIYIIRVVRPVTEGSMDEPVRTALIDERMADAAAASEALAERVRQIGLSAHSLSAYGDPREQICAAAATYDIELLAFGAIDNNQSVSGVAMGAIASHLLHNSPSNAIFMAHW